MKRIIFLVMLTFAVSACAQSGIYKHFSNRPGVRAYCVERYPMVEGDTICVTLFEANDSTFYQTLLKELKALPFTPVKDFNITIFGPSDTKDRPVIKKRMETSDAKKTLEGFTADGLDGEKGYYIIYCPSDRYIILAFLCQNIQDQIKVVRHMLSTEF